MGQRKRKLEKENISVSASTNHTNVAGNLDQQACIQPRNLSLPSMSKRNYVGLSLQVVDNNRPSCIVFGNQTENFRTNYIPSITLHEQQRTPLQDISNGTMQDESCTLPGKVVLPTALKSNYVGLSLQCGSSNRPSQLIFGNPSENHSASEVHHSSAREQLETPLRDITNVNTSRGSSLNTVVLCTDQDNRGSTSRRNVKSRKSRMKTGARNLVNNSDEYHAPDTSNGPLNANLDSMPVDSSPIQIFGNPFVRSRNPMNVRRNSSLCDDNEYEDIGDPDYKCSHCLAIFWYDERLKTNTSGTGPRYSRCCCHGKFSLMVNCIWSTVCRRFTSHQ